MKIPAYKGISKNRLWQFFEDACELHLKSTVGENPQISGFTTRFTKSSQKTEVFRDFHKQIRKFFVALVLLGAFSVSAFGQNQNQAAQTFPQGATAGTTQLPGTPPRFTIPLVDIGVRQPTTNQEVAFSVQILLLLTVLSLAPSLLILLTCFLRFSIVLDFIKRALSLQQVPPTVILNGIALFMTLFVMWPTFTIMYNNSFKPLAEGTIGLERAYTEAEQPIRLFMYRQMANNTEYIPVFMAMANLEKPNTLADVPTYVLIPSFILHELTVAFKIGIILYIPFIIIDMIVASILMSMGMIMLPPVQISMPFKLMLFVLVDGWGLLTQQLFMSIVR